MKTLGNIIFYIVVGIYLLVSWGICIKILWNWFIPSIFVEAPHVTYFQALEIGLVIGALTSQPILTPTREEEEMLTDSIATFLKPWLTLLLGWIILLVSK